MANDAKKPAVGGRQGATLPGAVPLAEGGADDFQTGFVWKVHDYTNNYIRFADSKAAVVVALGTGLLAGLVNVRAQRWLSPSLLNLSEPVWKDTWMGVFAFLSFALLSSAVACAVWAVAPRLWSTLTRDLKARVLRRDMGRPAKGFIFWGNILAHGTEDEFWGAFKAQDRHNLTEALTRHLYVLAAVADEKFRFANLSIWLAFAGGVVACLFILGLA